MTPPKNISLPIEGMSVVLSPNDSMFCAEYGQEHAWEHYLESGRTALRNIRAALASAGLEQNQVKRILDLPCGHGRIMRVLRAAFPQAHLTACDIDKPGVDFCAKTFGAEPVYSVEEPQKIPLKGQFDLIWVGSLLTHLDATRWPMFLNCFRRWLSPQGVCVFTYHGVGCEENLESKRNNYGIANPDKLLKHYRKYGFAYQSYGKGQNYGISASKADWVVKQIQALPKTRLVMLTEKGWHSHHDCAAFGPLPPPAWEQAA